MIFTRCFHPTVSDAGSSFYFCCLLASTIVLTSALLGKLKKMYACVKMRSDPGENNHMCYML